MNKTKFHIARMAPSAVSSPPGTSAPLQFQSRPIPGPKSFNRELELKGDDTYPAAKVLSL